MQGIKVVLWDIDGTLLDFAPAERHAIQTSMQEFGLPECTEEMLADYSEINKRYWRGLEKGQLFKKQVLIGRFRSFFERYGIDPGMAEKVNEAYQVHLGEAVFFFPGALELVQDLKAHGYIQCAVTNGTKVAQVLKLANSGLDKLLDYIFISEDVGHEKPSPMFFQQVLDTLSAYDKAEIIMVGDSLTSDILGGQNAGLRTIWFNPKQLPNKSDTQPDFVVQSMAEIRQMLL